MGAAENGYGARIRVQGTRFLVGTQEIWINGVNTPWRYWNDFGGRESWNEFAPQWWADEFARLKANGINATRIWMTCNGAGGIAIQPDGTVTGASAEHWADLDALFQLAATHQIYILATLISFDHTKDGNPNSLAWRNMYLTDTGIASMVNNYVVPFVNRYRNNPWLFAIEPCNEIEWVKEDPTRGGIAQERLIRYVASVAKAVRDNSEILVTQGAAAIKWNSTHYEGDWWSDASLGAQVTGARLDFYSPHYYDWQAPYYGVPFYQPPADYRLAVDKPALIGETPAKGSQGKTTRQDYEAALANGWGGVMAWTSNGVDDFGSLSNRIAEATQAIWQDHPDRVFPPNGPTFALTVVNGRGSGYFPQGGNALISAMPAPVGFAFAGWVGDRAALADPMAATTLVTMPDRPVSVTAVYATLPPVEDLVVYSDAQNQVSGTWGDGLAEVVGGAFEGERHYRWQYAIAGWWAGIGLNLDDWGLRPPLDVTPYTLLRLAVSGPADASHSLRVRLLSPNNGEGPWVRIPRTQPYARIEIPLASLLGGSLDPARVREIQFGLTEVESGSGDVYLDEIVFMNPQPSVTPFEQWRLENGVVADAVEVDGRSIPAADLFEMGARRNPDGGWADVLRIQVQGIDGNGLPVLYYPEVEGRSYRLQWNDDLRNPNTWRNVDEEMPTGNIIFYRVSVQRL